MTIDLSLTRDLFPLFYQLAFAAFIFLLILEGIKRGYPLSTWSLICTLAIGSAIVGSKIGSYEMQDFVLFFRTGELPVQSRKSDLGAILFLLTGIWIARRMLGFRSPVLPAFAFGLPLMILIQRIGCLMAGCSFGVPTHLPWGISYTGQGVLRDLQVYRGVIDSGSLQTAPVHPVPVYYMLGALATIAILYSVRKKLKNPCSLVLLSITLLAFSRFFIEFFRDPVSYHQMSEVVWGMKSVQWLIILVSLAGGLLVFLLERRPRVHYLPEKVKLSRNLAVIAIISLVLLIYQGWFTREEIAVLHLQTGLSAISLLVFLFQNSTRLSYKAASVAAIMSSFLMMGLTYSDTARPAPPDSTVWTLRPDTAVSVLPNKPNQKDFLLVTVTNADLKNTQYPCDQISSGCLGDYCSSEDLNSPMGPGYGSYRLGYEQWKLNKKTYWIYGLEGQIENYRNREERYSTLRANLYPYFGVGDEYFGIRLGVRLGSMFYDRMRNRGNYPVMPAGMIWFGYPNLFTMELGLFDNRLTGAGPVSIHGKLSVLIPGRSANRQGSIGIAFGFMTSWEDLAIGKIAMLDGEIPLGSKWIVIPGIGLSFADSKQGLAASLGVKYRLNEAE